MARRGTPDFFLFLMTLALVGFGVVMVFSASGPEAATRFGDSLWYTKKQLMAAGLGIFLMLVIMNIPYQAWKKLYLPFFLGVVGLLVFVLTQPSPGNLPRSWINTGVMSIQPAEFAKLAIILYLATIITRKGEKFEQFRSGLLPVALVVGFVGGLILLQPDFGTTVVFLSCATIVIIAGGARMKHLLIGVIAIAVAALLFFGGELFSSDDDGERGYQWKRIECFLDPWHDTQNWCWQQVQAEMAFGHGGIAGAGFGQSVQKLFYLPEAQNDFIFAIIGEELGFIGVTVFLLLYLAFLWRGIIVSLRCPDPFGMLVGIGIVGMFAMQAFINIGGVTRAIPMTGITLPFISSGGSSLLVSLMSMGVLLAVSRRGGTVESKQDRADKPDKSKRGGGGGNRRRGSLPDSGVPEHVPLIRT